ncbi:MAG: glycoside hydrolase family 99-like domain-containing protein [Bacteroidales bacterium]|nr:glycoside hydrolase family 99-like domain-containing protein [Bacteroidales bacterium]
MRHRTIKIILLSLCFGLFLMNSNISAQKKDAETYDIAAYVWPSCHHDARFGDMLWPEGTGEWEIIKKGNPRFEGHYQPKVPLWGYGLDDDPGVMEKWIDAATSHGVNIFIFDWYWFDEGPFLESSLNNGFLKAKNNDKMQFYLMWANHDVRRNYWNVHKFTNDTAIMWRGAVDRENFEIIVERVIKQYFKQPNYYKIDGCPVFSIFSIYNLMKSFGSIEETRVALDYFREETRKAGFPDLHIQMIAFEAPTGNLVRNLESLGVNSVTKYNWGGPIPEDYIQWGTESMERRDQWDKALNMPYFPNVSIGWDDSPRFPHKGKEHVVHYNKSPEGFASFLYKAKEYCDEHPEQPKLITVFSWNEWIEGGYLLPDIKYGFGHLEAVKKVILDGGK